MCLLPKATYFPLLLTWFFFTALIKSEDVDSDASNWGKFSELDLESKFKLLVIRYNIYSINKLHLYRYDTNMIIVNRNYKKLL